MIVRVSIAGRHYDLAEELPRKLELAEGASVADALATLQQAHPAGLPPTCLVAVSGRHLGTVRSHRSAVLRDGDELMLIAPVAGG